MGRAPCCDKAKVKRGPWSPEEDTILKNYLAKHGTGGNWIALPPKAGLNRCGKSCRLRWLNYLRPDIKHGGFTEEEDHTIYSLYRTIGSRWSVIASQLPGRTDNDIKNYWNTKLRKKVLAGEVCLSTTNNEIISNSTSQHLSSTPFSASIPKVENFYHGNSTNCSNSSSCILLPYATDHMSWQQQNLESQGIILDPIFQVPFPGLIEVSDYGSKSLVQEASSLSISSSLTQESNSVVSCSANGNVEEFGISLQEFGFDSAYEFLYDFDFQKATSHIVGPADLGNINSP